MVVVVATAVVVGMVQGLGRDKIGLKCALVWVWFGLVCSYFVWYGPVRFGSVRSGPVRFGSVWSFRVCPFGLGRFCYVYISVKLFHVHMRSGKFGL